MSETAEVVATPTEVSASLSAGFNKVRGDTPTESTPTPEVTPVEADKPAEIPSDAPKTEEAKAEPPKEEPIAGLGLTPSEVKAQLAGIGELRTALEASERKLQGKMGSLKSEFLELVKTAKTETPATVAKITRDTLKRTREQFGDDMADSLADDLSALMTAPAGTVDAEQINSIVQEKLAEAEAARHAKEVEKERARVFKAYPDVLEIRETPDFKIFKSLQPADVQAAISSSNDSDFVIDTLKGFDAWKAARDPAATKQKNTARLEGGLTPKSVPNNTPAVLPDKVGLSAGFNRVRKLG